MDLKSSESNFVIITNTDKLKIFCKIYWKTVLFVTVPIILLPIYFIGENNGHAEVIIRLHTARIGRLDQERITPSQNTGVQLFSTAYPCFYVFLITAVYWTTDAAHPAVIALTSLALSTLFTFFGVEIVTSIYVTSALLDSLGVMFIIVAMEHCNFHRRAALKILLIFGCSHYRISVLLFFTAMFLSMWISNIITCGLMIPLVKAIILELEKLGIIEMYEANDKSTSSPRKPTVLTSFYFLGIAYSSSIGGMATLFGSRTNQIFKKICETTFPFGPKIEFPQFMLLNLPGILLLEILVYLWLNFYFLGMFRSYHDAPLQMSMTEEESHYMNTLLSARYQQLGDVTFHETVVSTVVVLTAVLQLISSSVFMDYSSNKTLMSHIKLSAPSVLCTLLLFITPINFKFLRYFKRRSGILELLPTAPCKTCLNWELVKNNIPWSVLFVIGGSNTIFEALKLSKMTEEFEKFLLLFSGWPAPALVIIVIVFCKLLTEFASNSCVAYVMLPHIAKLSIMSKVNPHYLMLAATISTSLPFHLMTGTPANAMVLAYVHVPPRNMLCAGIGPSIIAMTVIWFTVTMWSKAIWTEINLFLKWADVNMVT